MDADFSHPPEKLLDMAEALKGADAVIGSRYVPGGSVDLRWPFWRKGLSAFGNFYARTILDLRVRDATGGFRLWRRETLQGMCLERVRSTGYAFQVETAYLAERLGYRFTEIPIYFADRQWGKSKMSFRIQREAAVKVWQMRRCYRDLCPLQHAHHQA
jgi:dolichol-phosphate mannosyltransferase